MKKTSTRLTTAVVLLGASLNGHALGLGNLRESAVLGRALDLTVPLRVEPGDDFSGECISAEVRFGEVPLRPSAVRARLEPDGRGIRVMTDVPVEEPVLAVAVSAGCKAKVSRTYTVFADPPVIVPPPVMAQAPAPAPARVAAAPPARRAEPPLSPAPPRAGPSSLPVAPAPAPAAAPARPPRARPAVRAPQGQLPQRPVTPPQARAGPAAPKPAAQSPQRGPRLQLDPLDAELAVPPLQLSRELTPPPAQTPEQRQAAAATWQALNATPEERIRDNERLLALERSLQEMRAESARTRESLDRLQAQLQRAEDSRYANPLVYLLVLVCVLLAAALAWMLRRQSVGKAWWAPSALAVESRRGDLVNAASSGTTRPGRPPAEAEPPAPDAQLVAAADAAAQSRQAADEVAQRTVAVPRQSPFRPSQPAEENGGSTKVSVEELIDLEQQAEFFVALGQEESAIELLRSHVSGHPDGSPLPYLKLLEIHQRRGERLPYEEIRSQFNERFNAYAPAWEDALSDGRSLEDYPTVISRLQALWENPSRALEVMQASLLRRDASSQTFDLPAYRELLMLYSVARDQVEGSPDTEIDVLLPLGEEGGSLPLSMLEPLTATTPVAPYDGAVPDPQVDLEIEPRDASAGAESGVDFERIRLHFPDDAKSAG